MYSMAVVAILSLLLCPTLIFSQTKYNNVNATPQEILQNVVTTEPALTLISKDEQADSPKHRYKTVPYVKGDFNKDGNDDIAICAVKKISDVRSDGYLVIATFKTSGWQLVQMEKFEYVSSPGLKNYYKEGFLLFFAGFTAEPPQKLTWNQKLQHYQLQDLDAKILLRDK